MEVDFIKNAPPGKVNARPSANPGMLTYDNLKKKEGTTKTVNPFDMMPASSGTSQVVAYDMNEIAQNQQRNKDSSLNQIFKMYQQSNENDAEMENQEEKEN